MSDIQVRIVLPMEARAFAYEYIDRRLPQSDHPYMQQLRVDLMRANGLEQYIEAKQ